MTFSLRYASLAFWKEVSNRDAFVLLRGGRSALGPRIATTCIGRKVEMRSKLARGSSHILPESVGRLSLWVEATCYAQSPAAR